MIIDDPNIYGGKKLKLHLVGGDKFPCKLDGYSYDYDDDGNEFMELTVVSATTGLYCDFKETDIESIEIL